MSGIAGMVNPFEDISHQCSYICSISDSIRTRGPNGTGLYVSPHIVLARRVGGECLERNVQGIAKLRLWDQDYVLVSSGMILNYHELRSELEDCGCTFQGTSSSELLLHAYATWQENALKKLNGHYAFALWSSRDKTLVLARDHLGAKPLYYAMIGSTLVFASEIKGILSHPHFKCTVGLDGLSELVCLSPRNSPGSAVIKGIHEIRPGHFVKYTPEGITASRYWTIVERPHEDDLVKTCETIRDLITDAANRQIRDYTSFCGLLSGGLYSSLVTTLVCGAMKPGSGVYNTWSVDFERSNKFYPDHAQDDADTPWIRFMCRKAGTRHHYIILSSDDLLDNLMDAAEARGFPGMGDYDVSLMLLCREISKDYPILLSGDCSDEIYGGGIKPQSSSGAGKRKFPWTSNLAEKISIFSPEIVDTIKPYEFIEKCYEEALAEYLKFSPNAARLGRDYEAEWFSLYWSMPFVLDRLDRMSMAYNLEARTPLCDYRIIEYLWNIPGELKNLNGVDRGLLREAMKDILPAEILARAKNPYPRMRDISYESKIKNLLKDIVYDTGSPIRYLLEIKTLEAMMRQQDQGKRYTSRSQLYSWLIQLNFFLKNNNITLL